MLQINGENPPVVISIKEQNRRSTANYAIVSID